MFTPELELKSTQHLGRQLSQYQNWEILNTIIISYPLTFLKIIAVSVVVIVSPSSISACLNHRSIWLSVMWEPSLCRSLPNEAKDWNCSLKVPSGSWKKNNVYNLVNIVTIIITLETKGLNNLDQKLSYDPAGVIFQPIQFLGCLKIRHVNKCFYSLLYVNYCMLTTVINYILYGTTYFILTILC